MVLEGVEPVLGVGVWVGDDGFYLFLFVVGCGEDGEGYLVLGGDEVAFVYGDVGVGDCGGVVWGVLFEDCLVGCHVCSALSILLKVVGSWSSNTVVGDVLLRWLRMVSL